MNTNNELLKMKKWGSALDKITQIVCVMVYVFSILGGVLIILNMFGLIELTIKLTFLGNPIDYQALSESLQIVVMLLTIAMLVIACIVIRGLALALRSVFQSIANGRPFEDITIKGFRKAALWIAIIGVLNLDFSGLVVAALLLFLSYVFHYGMLLQQESDETL